MKFSGWFRTVAVATGLFLAPSAVVAQSQVQVGAGELKDIIGVAADAGSFETLLAAVRAAGLTDTLRGGSFTVFAPTDAAFAKLPPGTVEALLDDPAQLATILTYHVVPGRVAAADVLAAGSAQPTTVNGQTLDIRVEDGTVRVDGATVTAADIHASNGVIHVIDSVVLPKPTVEAASR